MNGQELIPAAAFGPLGRPQPADLRFWRLIEDRKETAGRRGEQLVLLACGHQFVIAAMPDTQEYAFCAECFEKWKAPVGIQPALFEGGKEAF